MEFSLFSQRSSGGTPVLNNLHAFFVLAVQSVSSFLPLPGWLFRGDECRDGLGYTFARSWTQSRRLGHSQVNFVNDSERALRWKIARKEAVLLRNFESCWIRKEKHCQ